MPPVAPPVAGGPPAPPWPGHAPSGWPPPAYPPPYAHPYAHPGTRPQTGIGGLATTLIAVGVVLVLAFCGCVGLGVLSAVVDDPTADSYDGSEGAWPDEPDENGDPDRGLITAVPTRSPAVTPSGGAGRLTVVYEVTGTAPADLEYYDANGDFIQAERVELPWRLKLTTDGTERVMVLTSHSEPADTSPLGCRIMVNGKLVAEETNEYGADCYA
ncbi:MmpS family transport accessory protein [Micromonospora sp. MS34]|uniref:MmpS family transport accessory protein n=1 Tax=Micromonospora sp. MS34 TaxID=3385971 RepID=UPI0039A25B74